jgi:hypothetical protein
MEEVDAIHRSMILNGIIINICMMISYRKELYGLYQERLKMLGICGLRVIFLILYV